MNRFFVVLALIPFGLYGDDEVEKREPIDEVFVTSEVWKMTLPIIHKKYLPGKNAEDRVIEVESGDGRRTFTVTRGAKGFEWLSKEKRGLRAPGGQYSLLDQNIGEVVVRSSDGQKVSDVSISIFNRGDDGRMLKREYDQALLGWKTALDRKLKVRPEERKKAGAVKIDGWFWKKGRIGFLLEGSVTKKDNRVEFIRIRMGYADALEEKKKAKRRGSLEKYVTKKENGDVFVFNIPMVDQGQKGYCVVASVERVARYYGLDVDQHELAQLADATAEGTNPDKMEKAFKRLTGRIHVRTLKLMDFDYKQVERDVKSYDRLAKRAGAPVMGIDLDSYYINPAYFWYKVDPEVFKQVKVKQPKYEFFKKKTKEFVDQGVPICWTLYLGMFKEGAMPQSRGGHMRLIVGYNTEKEEILYTDSWGEGHELKRMAASEAWCMTMGMYAMVPNY